MTMRTGTCTSCGAQYGNIPPTVTATKVRCRKCGGEVLIPPLEAAAPAEPAAPVTPAPQAPEAPAAPSGGLQAKPIGDVQPKGNGERPASATPVDRKVARPEKPKAPAPPKKPAPPKPPAPKGGVKPPLPKKPVAAKPAPPKPAAPKPAAPKPPVAKPAPPEPAPAAPAKDPAKAADLMAKLKAKKAAEAPSEPAASSKGADVLAKLKAKKAAEAEPAAPAAAATGAGVPPRKKAAKGKAVPGRKTAAKPVPKKHTAAPKRNPEDGQHRHEHHHTKKKPPIVLTLVSVIALGGIGFGLKWFMDQGDAGTTPTPEETAQAPAGTQPAAAQPAATQPAAAQPESAPAAETSEPAASQPGAGAGTEPEPPAASEPAAEKPVEKPAPAELGEDPEWSPPEPGMEIEWRGYVHGDSFRLTEVPLLEKWSQTDDADWAGYVEDAELFWADEGASSMRAASRLVDGGRHAYPAMVNVMLTTDWDDPYSIGLCHSLNNRIVEIGKGTNLGWKTVDQLEPGTREWHDAIFFNKRVVIYWYNFWISKFANSDEEWDAFANKHQEKAAESKPAAGGNPGGGVDFDD